MTKLEDYTSKAEASLLAAQNATNERDRAFHQRASTIWRKLIRGIDEAEERAASQPAPKMLRGSATKKA